MDTALQAFITKFRYSLLLIPVWLVGIVLALVFWRRHPRVSLLALLALLGFLALQMFEMGMFLLWGGYLPPNAWLLSIRYFSRLICPPVLWALLLVALFGWRGRREA